MNSTGFICCLVASPPCCATVGTFAPTQARTATEIGGLCKEGCRKAKDDDRWKEKAADREKREVITARLNNTLYCVKGATRKNTKICCVTVICS